MIKYSVVVVSVILCLLRILGFKSILFQAVAHLFVGSLLGAHFMQKSLSGPWNLFGGQTTWYNTNFYFAWASILSVVELICFLTGFFK